MEWSLLGSASNDNLLFPMEVVLHDHGASSDSVKTTSCLIFIRKGEYRHQAPEPLLPDGEQKVMFTFPKHVIMPPFTDFLVVRPALLTDLRNEGNGASPIMNGQDDS